MKSSNPDPSEKPAVDPYAHHQPQTIREPRTMPAHWDLTEMAARPRPAPARPACEPAEAPSPAAEPGEETASGEEWTRNPFPEPRTYPSRWNLSG